MDTRIEKQNLPHSKLEKEEDILEKICLCKQNGIEMKIEKICHSLQIEKRSLMSYLKSLQKHGYIETVIPEKEIQLTDYAWQWETITLIAIILSARCCNLLELMKKLQIRMRAE